MKHIVPPMKKQGQGVSFSQTPPPSLTYYQVPQSQPGATAYRAAFMHTPATGHGDWERTCPRHPPTEHVFRKKKGLQQFGLLLSPGNSETRAEMLTCSLVIISCLVISTSSLSSTANAG